MTSSEFSFDTIENFDEHIDSSIPEYSRLADAIVSMSEFFTRPGTTVVDLGCSTGKLLERIRHDGMKIGVDVSENLLPESHDNVEYRLEDVKDFWEPERCSLILSVFTLQFIEPQYRASILSNVYDSLQEGGAFIWAEKVRSRDSFFEQVKTFSYYDYKRRSFTPEQIMDKERDLRKIMWPGTTLDNINLAYEAGFSKTDLFWKFHNFECWVLVK
jgi:tRNA (cmo5U34)-methyltransferase